MSLAAERISTVTLRAYAKINLGLRIIRKRADGYHDIETVFYRTHPYDEVTLERSESISLLCSDPRLPTDESNLCIRAAGLMQEHYGAGRGASISLKKFIPVGAGLGGGSSDAAAVLLGLRELWDIEISNIDLQKLAAKLGSDVPYFLQPGTAHATGRGEILDYFKFTMPYWIVIVHPDVSVSTSWAYKEMRITGGAGGDPHSGRSLKTLWIEDIKSPDVLRKRVTNDFEPIVSGVHPQITETKRALYDSGAVFAQMSGSGAAVYGLFDREDSARKSLGSFGKMPVFMTPPGFSVP